MNDLTLPKVGVATQIFRVHFVRQWLNPLSKFLDLPLVIIYYSKISVNRILFLQAQKHNVPTYISGFVIGTPNLCVALFAPFIGYFVSAVEPKNCTAIILPKLFYS